MNSKKMLLGFQVFARMFIIFGLMFGGFFAAKGLVASSVLFVFAGTLSFVIFEYATTRLVYLEPLETIMQEARTLDEDERKLNRKVGRGARR